MLHHHFLVQFADDNDLPPENKEQTTEHSAVAADIKIDTLLCQKRYNLAIVIWNSSNRIFLSVPFEWAAPILLFMRKSAFSLSIGVILSRSDGFWLFHVELYRFVLQLSECGASILFKPIEKAVEYFLFVVLRCWNELTKDKRPIWVRVQLKLSRDILPAIAAGFISRSRVGYLACEGNAALRSENTSKLAW